jgi:head-tail adaptor
MAVEIELPDLNRHQSALTVSDWQQLQKAFAAIRELQDELIAAQATIADHEARLIVLEP